MSEIPSRDFGKLEATVTQLETRLEKTVSDFESRVEKLTVAVDNLTVALNQAKGGWKTLAIVAGAGAAMATFLIKLSGMIKGF